MSFRLKHGVEWRDAKIYEKWNDRGCDMGLDNKLYFFFHYEQSRSKQTPNKSTDWFVTERLVHVNVA